MMDFSQPFDVSKTEEPVALLGNGLSSGPPGPPVPFDFRQSFEDAGYTPPASWTDITANYAPPLGAGDYTAFGATTGFAGGSFVTTGTLTVALTAGGAMSCLAGFNATDLWKAILDGTTIATWTGADETAHQAWSLTASGIILPAGNHTFLIAAHLTQPVNPLNFQALLLDKSVSPGTVILSGS